MSKSRSIANEIRLSQSFARLTLRQRDLWHGMIATADDQGRLPGIPAAVRSLVWPYDDVALQDVESDLQILAEAGNILIYEANGGKHIQIVNWWQYQKSQWAGKSNQPAPEGWLDRERYHGKGRKIFLKNWDTPGGFAIKVNDNDNDNDNDNARRKSKTTKVDDKGSQPASPADPEIWTQPYITKLITQISGVMLNLGITQLANLKTALDLQGGEKVIDALTLSLAGWKSQKRKDNNKNYSVYNPGWIDWGIEYLMDGVKRWENDPESREARTVTVENPITGKLEEVTVK